MHIKIQLLIFIFLFTHLSYASDSAENILKKMTLKEKISELFIFNIYKSNFDKQFKRIVKKHAPGSYILFGRDIKSARSLYNLTHKLQHEYDRLGKLPAFIMIDQEGGHVTRINTKPNLPSPLSVSTSGDPSLSYKVGVETSKILNLLGVNFNLAPVIDLSDPNKNNFIGNRSFGNNPDTVIKFASTQALAFEEHSIIPTFKHFPGHGGITQDSHKGLPKKMTTLKELLSHDLLPYKRLIQQHPTAAIMVGHIAFPNIDPSGVPTTFSKILLTDLLRKKLKFEGLIMTDDIQMKALKSFGSLAQRAKLAFNAGADLIMVTGSYRLQRNLIKNFQNFVSSNDISIKKVDNAVLRIIRNKLRIKTDPNINKLSFTQVLPKIKNSVISLKENSDLIIENNINISLAKFRGLLAKELNDISKIKIFSAYNSFYRQLKKSFPNKKFKLHKLKKYKSTPRSAFNKSKKSLNIFYVTGLGTLRMLKNLPNSIKRKTIVINSTHPGALVNINSYRNIVNVNSPYIYSGKLFADLIIDTKKRGLSSK